MGAGRGEGDLLARFPRGRGRGRGYLVGLRRATALSFSPSRGFVPPPSSRLRPVSAFCAQPCPTSCSSAGVPIRTCPNAWLIAWGWIWGRWWRRSSATRRPGEPKLDGSACLCLPWMLSPRFSTPSPDRDCSFALRMWKLGRPMKEEWVWTC